MPEIYELTARYDARASFYGKAHVMELDAATVLISYETPVMQIDRNGNVSRLIDQPESQTTARHMREFSKQFCGGVALDSIPAVSDINPR